MFVKIVTISDSREDYARKVAAILIENKLGAVYSPSSDKCGQKIREAMLTDCDKIIVIGENEEEAEEVIIRERDDNRRWKSDAGTHVKIKDMVNFITQSNQL